ncbi:DUF3304 domain-containing protein [Bacillus subtilis]|nr:DUF3304 domain-containing protein [Bacillus subtilis]AYK62532.1 DUF3304 domain-containing protein [Bacillus subtilis subsp. subtilis]MDR4252843.1 DUF3304 domain-containing protein [Bacillus subtilis subsp. subtilis NCIB 3610 = ATCC 6051 = DSM 10]MDR4277841.1 DUF3304 domain-containing protein [Bacillus subtilis KCTC 1028 = ATCC 6051a]QDW07888.1 DUF3304 domain-containing protein [Bacillus sp. KBS0812]
MRKNCCISIPSRLRASWRTGKSVSLLWTASSKKHGSQKRQSMEKRSSKQERAILLVWNLKSATN